MSRTWTVAAVIALAAAAFISGAATSFYFMNRFVDTLVAPFLGVDRYTVEIMEDWASAYLLYNDGAEKALAAINARIDSNILAVGELLPEVAREDSRANAIQAMHRVRGLRDVYGYASPDREVQRKLEEIYRRYPAGGPEAAPGSDGPAPTEGGPQ